MELLCFVFIAYLSITSSRDTSATSGAKPVIRVVVYDKIRGYLNWHNQWFKDAAAEKCSTTCIFSESLDDISSADVVLFHAPTHGQSSPHKPRDRIPQSIYALISLEQPKYAKILSNKKELQTFDLLLTYSLQPNYPGTSIPNIPLSYYPLNILSPHAVQQPSRTFKEKDGYGTGELLMWCAVVFCLLCSFGQNKPWLV